MTVMYLPQEYNTMIPLGFESGPFDLKSNAPPLMPPHLGIFGSL